MYRIILIDDDTETLETIAVYYDWDKMGIELVRTVNNGLTGLHAILELEPDIVLIDIKMPGMDGLTVIQETQKRGLNPYFIVISGHADFEYAQTALRLSVGDYLLKPYSPEDLKKVFEKAVRELERRIENLIIPKHAFPRSGSDVLHYPVDCEKAIMNTIFVGQKQELGPALDCFIEQIFAKNNTSDALACVSMLCSAIVRPLIERRKVLGVDPVDGIRWEDRDLVQSIRQVLLTVADETYAVIHAESTINPAVIAAEKYIRAHYHEKLTLDTVAEEVYITPTYLSSLFSKTLGTSFVSYVNQVRIERAQELLRDAGTDPNEVAEQVGFADARYFAQVFKRITGRTPNQYRNQLLHYDDEQG